MAIFKVKITNDYEQEQNKLKKGMEVEVFTRLPTATIYGGAEIKKSIERKYSIQVYGTGWNTETTLKIEKLDENDLINLELELQFIKSEKEKIVKAQLFEEAGNLRDYEKEVKNKIYNMKNEISINRQLEELYKSKLLGLKEILKLELDIDGPIIMNSWEQEYLNSKLKVLYIGQENNGWSGYVCENYDELKTIYEDYKLSKNGKRTIFWQYVYYVNSILNPENKEGNNFLWTNVSKFCTIEGKSLDFETHKISVEHFNCLKEEISILKPDVVLFFSGPNYDDKIRVQFETDLLFEKVVEEIPVRELAIISNISLPKHTYRMYHPKSMQLQEKTEHLEIILKLIKGETE